MTNEVCCTTIKKRRRKLIDQLVLRLLTQAKAIGVFPTPIERLIAFTSRAATYPAFCWTYPSGLASWVDKLRPAWWPSSRSVEQIPPKLHLTVDQLPSNDKVAQLSQAGRVLVPVYLTHWLGRAGCSPVNYSLQPVSEAEIRYFALRLLFQHDRFDVDIRSLQLNLKTGLYLGQKYGSSVREALEHMVSRSARKCAVLELGPGTPSASQRALLTCRNKGLLMSGGFRKSFDGLVVPLNLNRNWTFANDFLGDCYYRDNGQIVLNTTNGFGNFRYQFLRHNDAGLVFLIPEREYHPCQTTVELTGGFSDHI